MWMPLLGLIIGLLIGIVFPISIPAISTKFLAIVALCSIDSLLLGLRAKLYNKFNTIIFTNEFILNSILSIGLVYLGDVMGTNLFTAVAIIITARIFYNLSNINHYIFLQKP